MLKAELHTHVEGDPRDKIKYTARELIDRATELNFDVLGITCHNYVYEEEGIKEYAQSKNILLLLEMERDVEGKHTLVYNITNEEAGKINSFAELQELKERKKEVFVIAPHPFNHAPVCLKNRILKYLDLFDAWEYSFFYLRYLNPNLKTLKLARKHRKPLVGNSDVHLLKDLGKTYTLIDAEQDEKSVFQAVREGRTEIVSNPLSSKEFSYATFRFLLSFLRNRLKNS